MITLDNVALKDYNINITYNYEDSVTPNITANFKTTNFGAINYGITLGLKEFTFNCYVSDGIAESISQLKALLFDEKGETKEVELQFLSDTTKFYRVMLSEAIKVTYITTVQAEFTLKLTATVPLAYSVYKISNYFETMSGTPNHVIPITYCGSYPSSPAVSFLGDVSYFDIEEHKHDGTVHVFHYISDRHNTFLTIDFSSFSIVDNGVNCLPNSSGDFLQIDKNTKEIIIRGDIEGSLNFEYTEVFI